MEADAMTAATTQVPTGATPSSEPSSEERPTGEGLWSLAAGLAVATAAASVPVAAGRGELTVPDVLRAVLVIVSAISGAVIHRAGQRELGRLLLLMSVAAAALNLGVAADRQLAWAFAVALLPPAALHVVSSLPDGRLDGGGRRALVVGGYAVGALVGAAAWTGRSHAVWPGFLEAAGLAAIGLPVSFRLYQRTRGVDRQRMQWMGLAALVVIELSIVLTALRLFVSWPPYAGEVAAGSCVLLPLALVAASSPRMVGRVDRLLTSTVSVAGLSAVVVSAYLLIVIGLGRAPRENERALFLLSMVAAATIALVWLPARQRLSDLADRVVYGERRQPQEALTTFGARLSRALPLDELLLQLAESLRATMALRTAEIWIGSQGVLDRVVGVPERREGAKRISLGSTEASVVARAGVSGPGWARIWMPVLLEHRTGDHVRIAPLTHSGQLLGLIVVDRAPDHDPFGDDEERVLTELARQTGLALHNVELDSALQASLDQVRQQADELRASRARIVATADAERRRIERNLHDGAQQHLVALAVKARLARDATEDDVGAAQQLLDELAGELREAVQELRELAHGIYPPLLMESGLREALRAASGRAALPTEVEAEGIGRYPTETEAAAYFCCLEAMQNAGKHAGEGAGILVRLWEEAEALVFEVRDDGVGFDVSSAGGGHGFVNMADRVGAIGGSLRVESTPGAGTTITGAIPVAS